MTIVSPAAAAVARFTAGARGSLLPIGALAAALADDAHPRRWRTLPARFMLNLYVDEALPDVLLRDTGAPFG